MSFIKKIKDKIINLYYLILALTVLTMGIEFLILFVGIIWGPLNLDDIDLLIKAAPFHIFCFLITIISIIWKKTTLSK